MSRGPIMGFRMGPLAMGAALLFSVKIPFFAGKGASGLGDTWGRPAYLIIPKVFMNLRMVSTSLATQVPNLSGPM